MKIFGGGVHFKIIFGKITGREMQSDVKRVVALFSVVHLGIATEPCKTPTMTIVQGDLEFTW
jgi:hypothetical protein